MTAKPLPTYSSFLLRLWREEGASDVRMTLQNVADGKQLHFTDPQRLLAFLREHNTTLPKDAP